ncbi:unnamed protein product, partial [Amoebophrya sp. A120]|eukprot:GSA120T00017664001.1
MLRVVVAFSFWVSLPTTSPVEAGAIRSQALSPEHQLHQHGATNCWDAGTTRTSYEDCCLLDGKSHEHLSKSNSCFDSSFPLYSELKCCFSGGFATDAVDADSGEQQRLTLGFRGYLDPLRYAGVFYGADFKEEEAKNASKKGRGHQQQAAVVLVDDTRPAPGAAPKSGAEQQLRGEVQDFSPSTSPAPTPGTLDLRRVSKLEPHVLSELPLDILAAQKEFLPHLTKRHDYIAKRSYYDRPEMLSGVVLNAEDINAVPVPTPSEAPRPGAISSKSSSSILPLLPTLSALPPSTSTVTSPYKTSPPRASQQQHAQFAEKGETVDEFLKKQFANVWNVSIVNIGTADGVSDDPLTELSDRAEALVGAERDPKQCALYRQRFPRAKLLCEGVDPEKVESTIVASLREEMRKSVSSSSRTSARTTTSGTAAPNESDSESMKLSGGSTSTASASLNSSTQHQTQTRTRFSILKIDIDSFDCVLAEKLLQLNLRPDYLVMEVNAAVPPPFEFAMPYEPRLFSKMKTELAAPRTGGHIRSTFGHKITITRGLEEERIIANVPLFSCSLSSMVRQFGAFGYSLVFFHYGDAVFVSDEVWRWGANYAGSNRASGTTTGTGGKIMNAGLARRRPEDMNNAMNKLYTLDPFWIFWYYPIGAFGFSATEMRQIFFAGGMMQLRGIDREPRPPQAGLQTREMKREQRRAAQDTSTSATAPAYHEEEEEQKNRRAVYLAGQKILQKLHEWGKFALRNHWQNTGKKRNKLLDRLLQKAIQLRVNGTIVEPSSTSLSSRSSSSLMSSSSDNLINSEQNVVHQKEEVEDRASDHVFNTEDDLVSRNAYTSSAHHHENTDSPSPESDSELSTSR